MALPQLNVLWVVEGLSIEGSLRTGLRGPAVDVFQVKRVHRSAWPIMCGAPWPHRGHVPGQKGASLQRGMSRVGLCGCAVDVFKVKRVHRSSAAGQITTTGRAALPPVSARVPLPELSLYFCSLGFQSAPSAVVLWSLLYPLLPSF